MFVTRNLIRRVTSASRGFATQSKLVEVSQNEKNGITIISMAHAPINAMNLEFSIALRKALEDAQDAGSKGVILTSSLPTVFSAGLDIMEMYKADLKRAQEFWKAVQELWITLYSLGIPTAAAINGAAPAGGCVLAMSCEYRVFVEGKHAMGMNETQLGLVATRWMQTTLETTIGKRKAELALLKGTLFTPQESLQVGLVDELATDKKNAIERCEKYIESFKRIPAAAREAAKLAVRKDALAWMEENKEWDLSVFLNYVQMPQVQAGLENYIKMLKAKQQVAQ